MVQLIFNGLDKIEHSMQLQLEVESAFYETLWFRLLLLVSASGFIFLIIQAYTFYLRRQNQQLEHQVSLRTQELDKMNQTLSAYNLQLIASEKELKQSISLKNRLISIITHDIITPLRFIAMVARNTEADTKQDELLLTLNDIHHTSIRLHDNAQNILNWIKHQTSKIEVSRTNVPLFAIVEEITELLKEPSQSVNVELINNIELDKLIITDRNILSIMLHNIVSNAVKYTRNSTVNIGSTDSNGFTDITISDNGSGIQQSMLQRIKKVLNREQSYFIDDTSGGHGLGFIIISELSQLIGATVEIQSSSEGTTVIFKIPTTN
jgi:signal transduction histidine kinase